MSESRPRDPASERGSEQALLALIEADRDRQIAALRREADARADAVRAQAREAALRRVRETVAERRRLHAAAVAAAQARCATQRRLHAQRHETAWLRLAWQRLPGALQAAWTDGARRAAWARRALAEALAQLPREAWSVQHDPAWPAAERQAWAGAATAAGVAPPVFEPVDGVVGLRVVCGGTVIDASAAGLLSDRAAVEARLLHLLESGAAAEGIS